ncbi:MAG TPA: glycosyltransferase family 4 protein [Chloroflexota bacterium]|nr:glycosyltransferase family 4 protein [Chloroflexota bacterium]
MTRRLLIVHYTPPGVIGGVELIIHQHIQILKARGFEIDVVAGRPGNDDAPLHVLPELDTAAGLGQQVEAELARGLVGESYHAARRAIEARLDPLIDAADSVITHNAYTLHFSLPLTSVLWESGRRQAPGKMIAWCHDIAWTNPLYIPSMHDGPPWSLLREPAPNTTYVTVSEERRQQLLGLWSNHTTPVGVIPNGIDVAAFLRLSAPAREIARRFDLLACDLVLLLPVRITRRKNIELAIRAVRALKDRGLRVRFLISGPQAPHHPGLSDRYLDRLKELRAELDVTGEVIFVADALGENLESATVAELYTVADALFFPSSQEGFGLPILEAGLTRVPVVLSDIPVFREVGGADVVMFELDDSPDTIADRLLAALDTPASRLYRRVLREFRWDAIVDRQIMPLLGHPEAPHELESRAATAPKVS